MAEKHIEPDGTKMDRRGLLQMLAAAGLTAGTADRASAAANEIVIANWGGPAATAFTTTWGDQVSRKLGAKLVIDGSGPSTGKIRAMVEANHVTWDVCDASVGAALLLGKLGLLEPIDYNIVGTAVAAPYRYQWAVCNYIFSYVLAFNSKALDGRRPASWKDFWNVKDFPGKRTLRGSCIGQLECALLADGVPADKIYPIDLKRALEKIKEIREHTIFWKSGSQSEDLFRQGDVVMGNMWHNRTNLLRIESKGAIDWTWQGGVIAPAVWVVPKGNPAGKQKAMDFIALSMDPASQVELFKLIGMGPSNPEAAALIPEALRPYDPAQPANLAKQILINEDWYTHNLVEAEKQYLDIFSS
jgi:putative spermidine/putrescine transport system substrate-binding protein